MSQAANKVLDLLVAVIGSGRPRGLMEVASEANIDKSTAARLLSLLVARGFLIRDAETRRYEMGPGMLGLLAAAASRMDIRSVAATHLGRIRDAVGETVSLHLRLGRHRVCVDGVESEHPVRRVVPLGESLPLYLGPSGKVILASLPERDQSLILADARDAGVDLRRLREQLRQFANDGYAITDGDRSVGIRAASAPIFGMRGVVASITIAGPSERWQEAKARASVAQLLEAAQAVSTALGGHVKERVQ